MKLAFPLGMVMLIFSSCQKIMDYYNIRGFDIPLPSCRIKSYTTTYYETTSKTTIQYDGKGNPVLIIYLADWLPDGAATETFKYDTQGRLISHEPDPYMGNKREYVYEGNARTPLRDTATDLQGKRYLETFKTDAKGRIVELEIKLIYTPPDLEDDFEFQTEVHRYYYDVHGNRQVNPFDYPWHRTIRYSDKPSLYSLSPVWQIIHRDYSKNGVTNVRDYSSAGLPITFVFDEFAYWQPFLDMTQNSVVEYECQGVEAGGQ
jgi:hypothetical protein